MRRDEALRLLAEHREELAGMGVASLDLFGSVLRDEAGSDSDVDLLVELDRPPEFTDFGNLQRHLEGIFGTKVDLVRPGALRPWLRERVLRDVRSNGRSGMPAKDWTGRVEDILDAAAKIERYTEGMTFEAFAVDDRTADAVTRNIGITGEAARHVPEEARSRYPAIPWAKMNGMRNVVIRDYPAVDLVIVWDVIQHQLPPLVPSLRELLERERAAGQ